MEQTGFVRTSLLLVGGLIVWAIHLAIVYGFNALACARRFAGMEVFGMGIVPAGVAMATVVALAAVACVLAAGLRGGAGENRGPTDAFMRHVTAAVAALSLVAISWNGLPALIVPPCG